MKILGREALYSYMKEAAKSERYAHAYIFEGEDGIGKLFFAKQFAKMILCTSKKIEDERRATSCETCVSCKQVIGGNNPDIIYVSPDKASGISVDEIRTKINADIEKYPYGEYKVYIIKNAESMNENAQNALLKTIEEPPFYAIIILLSENNNKLLKTIRSRCIEFSIKPVDIDTIKKYLIEEYGVVDYIAEIAAKFSAGNIGRAVRYATDDDFLEMKNLIVRLLRNLDNNGMAEILEGLKSLEGYKKEIKDCIELMVLWFRDLLVLKATGDVNKLLFNGEYKSMKLQIEKREYETIEKAIEMMKKTKQRLMANVRFETAMEIMILYMKDR